MNREMGKYGEICGNVEINYDYKSGVYRCMVEGYLVFCFMERLDCCMLQVYIQKFLNVLY